MKILFPPFLMLLLLIGCKHSDSLQGKMERLEINIDDTTRSYWVFNPLTTSAKKSPLIIIYHGAFGSGIGMSDAIHFNDVARDQGFIVAYPDALVGNWAEGCDCNNADRLEVKDLAFTHSIIDKLSDDLPIDKQQIYAVGFSQGGLFAGRLACEATDTFRAYMVVAATMSVPLSENCDPSGPINITIIQGTSDVVLPYNGSKKGKLSLLSAKETARYWARKNNINGEPAIIYRPNNQNQRVEVQTYGGSAPGSTQVSLMSIIFGLHEWPSHDYLDANQEIKKMVIRNY